MPNILDEIVEAKTKELAQQKQDVSFDDLKKAIASQPKALSLAAALGAGGVTHRRGQEGLAFPGAASPQLRPGGVGRCLLQQWRSSYLGPH